MEKKERVLFGGRRRVRDDGTFGPVSHRVSSTFHGGTNHKNSKKWYNYLEMTMTTSRSSTRKLEIVHASKKLQILLPTTSICLRTLNLLLPRRPALKIFGSLKTVADPSEEATRAVLGERAAVLVGSDGYIGVSN